MSELETKLKEEYRDKDFAIRMITGVIIGVIACAIVITICINAKNPTNTECTNCNRIFSAEYSYCPYCGEELKEK